MLDHVCAIPHRSSRVTSFRRFVGAMSGGGRWPRMPGLVRHWRSGRGDSTRWVTHPKVIIKGYPCFTTADIHCLNSRHSPEAAKVSSVRSHVTPRVLRPNHIASLKQAYPSQREVVN